jgi:hypothetical protein
MFSHSLISVRGCSVEELVDLVAGVELDTRRKIMVIKNGIMMTV